MTTPGIGHNGPPPSYEEVRLSALDAGLCRTQRDCLMHIIDDPRMTLRHMKVLKQLVLRASGKTGEAFPGHARLVEDIIYHVNGEARHYSPKSIKAAITDLIAAGYVVTARKAPEGGRRALAHYVTRIPADFEAAITAFCLEKRAQEKRGFPTVRVAPEVHAGMDLSGPASSLPTDAEVAAQGWPEVNAGMDLKGAEVHAGMDLRKPAEGYAGMDLRKAEVHTAMAAEVHTGVAQELVTEGTSNNTPVVPKPTQTHQAADATVLGEQFEQFWRAFPGFRKKSKPVCRDLFIATTRGKGGKSKKLFATAEQLIQAAKAFADHCRRKRTDPQYIESVEVWLNNGRWEDDACQPSLADRLNPDREAKRREAEQLERELEKAAALDRGDYSQ